MTPCCHIGCEKPATKEILYPPFGVDDNTLMCDEHAPEYTKADSQVAGFKQPAATADLPSNHC